MYPRVMNRPSAHDVTGVERPRVQVKTRLLIGPYCEPRVQKMRVTIVSPMVYQDGGWMMSLQTVYKETFSMIKMLLDTLLLIHVSKKCGVAHLD